MGVIQLTTVTAINMMGSGIILLPSKLAEIGTVSIFAWILASIGATLLAYAFSVCGMYGKKTILFVDEIHRFNKGQQDYLLLALNKNTDS